MINKDKEMSKRQARREHIRRKEQRSRLLGRLPLERYL